MITIRKRLWKRCQSNRKMTRVSQRKTSEQRWYELADRRSATMVDKIHIVQAPHTRHCDQLVSYRHPDPYQCATEKPKGIDNLWGKKDSMQWREKYTTNLYHLWRQSNIESFKIRFNFSTSSKQDKNSFLWVSAGKKTKIWNKLGYDCINEVQNF